MNIQIIQHETFEAPGAYLKWAIQKKHQVTISKVYEFDVLPAAVDDIDLLIVMGGPQSPDTTTEECPHFNAAAEMALIKKCITAGKAVVGVCLGAQLIGEALGAKHSASQKKKLVCFP